MTEDEILRIKEHIEIHARREPRARKITEILWKAVSELEHIAELEKENAELKANFDYVLEGKDLEIKELGECCNQLLKDKDNLTVDLQTLKNIHEEEVVLHHNAEEYIKCLEAQIEKMRRCSNCEDGKGGCKYRTIFTMVCDKWSMRND